jgi:hypothetical protein
LCSGGCPWSALGLGSLSDEGLQSVLEEQEWGVGRGNGEQNQRTTVMKQRVSTSRIV